MIAGVESSPLGATDAGADRDTRIPKCTLRPWCRLYEHSAHLQCDEVPSVKRDVAEPIPALRSPSFTEQLRKANKR